MTIKSLLKTMCLLLLFGGMVKASEISCTTAPCVTSTVTVTSTASTAEAFEFSASANPQTTGMPSTRLAVQSNFYTSGGPCNASFRGNVGAWISSDPGSSAFTGGCAPQTSTLQYASDPITGAYFNGNATTKLYGGAVGSNSGAFQILYRTNSSGTTWGSTTLGPTPTSFDTDDSSASYVPDFDSMIVDSTGSSHDRCGYISFTNVENNDGDRRIEVSHACPADTGTWTNVAVDTFDAGTNAVDFSHLDMDGNGNLFLTWIQCAISACVSLSSSGTTAHVYLSTSTDGGATWSAASNIFDITMSPDISDGHGNVSHCTGTGTSSESGGFGCLPGAYSPTDNAEARLTPHPQIVTWSTGISLSKDGIDAVYETWNGTSMEVDYRVSTDGGTTWGSQNVISSQTNDQFFPCAKDDLSGNTAAMWLDRRDDTNNKKYGPYVSYASTSTGAFGTSHRLSTNSSDPSNNGYGGPFLGDYTGCTWWAGSGTNNVEYFVGVWPDTSNGSHSVGMLAGFKH